MKTRKIAFPIAIIFCIFLTGCGNTNTKVSTEDTTLASEGNINVGKNSEETAKATTKMDFWINSMDWSKEQKDDVTLYNKMSLPIKIEDLDRYSAPYAYYHNSGSPITVETMEEVLKSEIALRAKGEATIYTQRKKIDGKLKDYYDEPDNIEKIIIKNYNDSSTTIAECYNNGWWYIQSFYDIDDALEIDLSNTEYARDRSEKPILDMAIEKLGSPSYVMSSEKDFESANGGISYSLVYEYDEYVLSFYVTEMILEEYNTHTVDVHTMTYYTKECWETERSQRTTQIYIIDKN